MSQKITNILTSRTLTEPILTPELVKTIESHDQIRWIGPTGAFTWTEKSWGAKTNSRSVDLVKDKVYTLMCSPVDQPDTYYAKPGVGFYFMRMTIHVEDLSNWTLAKSRHDEVLLKEKQKRAWTMASKTFPRIRNMFKEAVDFGRNRVKWDLKDLELSKKMELLTKLTPSELGLLEFLEKDSGNPQEDVKKLFEVYYLYTSQQNEQKGV